MGKHPAKRNTIFVLLCGVFSYEEGVSTFRIGFVWGNGDGK